MPLSEQLEKHAPLVVIAAVSGGIAFYASKHGGLSSLSHIFKGSPHTGPVTEGAPNAQSRWPNPAYPDTAMLQNALDAEEQRIHDWIIAQGYQQYGTPPPDPSGGGGGGTNEPPPHPGPRSLGGRPVIEGMRPQDRALAAYLNTLSASMAVSS